MEWVLSLSEFWSYFTALAQVKNSINYTSHCSLYLEVRFHPMSEQFLRIRITPQISELQNILK